MKKRDFILAATWIKTGVVLSGVIDSDLIGVDLTGVFDFDFVVINLMEVFVVGGFTNFLMGEIVKRFGWIVVVRLKDGFVDFVIFIVNE